MNPKIIPKKSLGQNFLVNQNVIQKIQEICAVSPGETIVEIGPGQGALTEGLSSKTKNLILIEKDKRLIPILKSKFQNTQIKIIEGDVLKVNFNELSETTLKLVGNLPYNIATAIIEKIIFHRRNFSRCFVMVQLEHAKRIMAKPHCKDYGSFSLFVQFYCNVKKHLTIKKGSFQPIPKVDSAFLELSFDARNQNPIDETHLFQIIRLAFSQRRKQLVNVLAQKEDKEHLIKIFQKLNLKRNLRAENLTLEEFIILSQEIKH